jgi:hypothetical protein
MICKSKSILVWWALVLLADYQGNESEVSTLDGKAELRVGRLTRRRA